MDAVNAMIVDTLRNADPFLIVSCLLGGFLAGLGVSYLVLAERHRP